MDASGAKEKKIIKQNQSNLILKIPPPQKK